MGTTAGGYPYPEGTDLVVDGDDAIQALAEMIEHHGFVAIDSGYVQFPEVNANGGSKSVSVSFTPGRFSVAPIPPGPLGQQRMSWTLSTISATSMTLTGVNFTGIDAPTARTRWIAVQSAAPAPIALLAAGSSEDLGSEPATGTVTCPTDGCPSRDVPVIVAIEWTDEAGETHPVDAIFCGPCGTDITATMQATS